MAGKVKTVGLLKTTYEHVLQLQRFTARCVSSVKLPALSFGDEQPAVSAAKLEAAVRGASPAATVASSDSVATAAATFERADEECAHTRANLLVYLQALTRTKQALEARERETRIPPADGAGSPVAAGVWDVASHRATGAHPDDATRCGVRLAIFDGLARTHVLLRRLEDVFAFVFSPTFHAEALGSLRGNQATRGAWAGRGGLVPDTKPRNGGKRRRAAAVAAAATAAAVASVDAAAARAGKARKRAAAASRRAAAPAATRGDEAFSSDSESDSDSDDSDASGSK